MPRSEGCGVGIVGLGVALPETVRRNDWWASRTATDPGRDFVRAAERAMRGAAADDDPFRGTVERRVLEDHLRPSDLEIAACRDALRTAAVTPGDVDLLLGFSQVPDDICPASVGRVAHELGLPREVTAIDLDAGCASFLPHLTTAVRFIEARDHRVGLLFQSSATSRVTDYDVPSSVLVGDGAVAQVVAAVEPGLGFVGRVQLLRGELADGVVIARTDGDARWYDGGTVAPMAVTSRDRAAAREMGARGAEFAAEACGVLLERHGVGPGDVDFFACAQATSWFGEACAKAVGVREGRYTAPAEHFQRYGHLLAGSAPLNLWVAWSTGRLRKGDLVLVYSPGVGLVQCASLVRWAMDPPRVTPTA